MRMSLVATGCIAAICLLALVFRCQSGQIVTPIDAGRQVGRESDGESEMQRLLIGGRYSDALVIALNAKGLMGLEPGVRDAILGVLCQGLEAKRLTQQEVGVWSGWCAEHKLLGPIATRWCQSVLASFEFVNTSGYFRYARVVLESLANPERRLLIEAMSEKGRCTIAGRAYCCWDMINEDARLLLVEDAVRAPGENGCLQIALEYLRWDRGAGLIGGALEEGVRKKCPALVCALGIVCPAMIRMESARWARIYWGGKLEMADLDDYKSMWSRLRNGPRGDVIEWLAHESGVAIEQDLSDKSSEGLVATWVLYQMWCRLEALDGRGSRLRDGLLRSLQFSCLDKGLLQ